MTGCAFCNLNLQWDGYRSKTAKQVAADIDYLTDRHQTLSVALMDDVLPTKNAHKGTAVIQNLEIMKNCEALGIRNISNLILQFQGSDEDDVAATLQALEFALPFPIQTYRGDLTYQKKIWTPVRKKLSDWQQQYAEVRKDQGDSPILRLRSGGNFCIIRRRRYKRH